MIFSTGANSPSGAETVPLQPARIIHKRFFQHYFRRVQRWLSPIGPVPLLTWPSGIAGETDLCILAEPYITRSIGANPEIVPLLDLSLEWNRVEGMMPAETAFLCRGDLAGERGQEVAEMVASLAESASLALKHPEYGVDAHRLHFNVVPAARAEGEIRSYLEIFFRNAPASIGGRIPDEKFLCQ